MVKRRGKRPRGRERYSISAVLEKYLKVWEGVKMLMGSIMTCSIRRERVKKLGGERD